MRKLVIAEKPSVARDIASALGKFAQKDGYLENDHLVISWALGHLLELADAHEYAPALVKWTLEQLPILPEEFKLHPIRSGAKQLKILKQLLNSADVAEVINACDAGREGELIFRRIYEWCGCRKPIKRLWLSEATPSAIRDAFKKLRDGRELDNLAAAARARAEADWIVGINATRVFSVKHKTLLSVGRVQTPTLALVVQREREIRGFKPETYWEVWAAFQKSGGATYRGRWFRGGEGRIKEKSRAEELVRAALAAGSGRVAEVEKRSKTEAPPLLFNLNDLQKEANRKYGMTAQQTLNAAQSLYEKYKLITYPRTDSRHLTEALARDTLQKRLAALEKCPEYGELVRRIRPGMMPGKRHVDDAGVTDHHAIIPTDVTPDPAALNPVERHVYDLVVRRFLAMFYPPAVYDETKVVTEAGGETFKSGGRVEIDPGWKAVYGPEEKEEKDGKDEDGESQPLPPLAEGETVAVEEAGAVERQTKPPKRYTEATLLAAMENAGRLVDDREMAETLKAAGGIGTPATRAAIIETLIKRGYIERRRKTLVPTLRGEALIDLVPEKLKSVELTAQWEDGLRRIEEGLEDARTWLHGLKNFTREVVAMAKEQEANGAVHREEVMGKCPLCGRDVVEFARSYGCSGYKEGCRFAIWKEIAGKKITVKQAKELLWKGKTGVIKGFKSKAGKSFDAALTLSEDGRVNFEFADHAGHVLGRCPLCGKDVIEGKKGYGCAGWNQGCKFIIWKEIAGKKITVSQAKELLQKGKTGVIKGFKSKAGREFEAVLVLGEDGKIEFEFKTDRGDNVCG
ncbi:DNA topoisomerase III [Desulfofundulus salinus]|uniref:DNA topoisomerase n=1 Tax=Desulfofundulus salinus TaxID=2419843 RepID=A0A494WUE4_9FIRM|nr:DNA topoisomerase III [Desulfofundulus salinum]RKO65732.1 DNA topoisomerase III [Desulfofundulus salinum]